MSVAIAEVRPVVINRQFWQRIFYGFVTVVFGVSLLWFKVAHGDILDRGDSYYFLCFGILALIFSPAFFFQARNRRRFLRAMIDQDSKHAPPTAFQAPIDQALPMGRSLAISITPAWQLFVLAFLFIVMVVGSRILSSPELSANIDMLLHGLPLSPLLLIRDGTLVMLTVPFSSIIFTTIRPTALRRLSLSDEGITAHYYWRPRQFIAWSALLGVARVEGDGKSLEFAQLIFISAKTVIDVQLKAEHNVQKHTVDGQAITDLAPVNMAILATIHDRTGLLVRNTASKVSWSTSASLEDIQQFPIVATPPLSISAWPLETEVELKTLIPAWKVWRNAGIWDLSIFGFVAGLVILASHGEPGSEDATIFILIVIAIAVLLILPFITVFESASLRSGRYPEIVATPDHLVHNRKTYDWTIFHTWVVELPQKPGAGSVYHLYMDKESISWVETPESELAGKGVYGDRRTAFQMRTEELHVYIAARTGLVLRRPPVSE